MDLVDWDERVFQRIYNQFDAFASRLCLPDVTVIPISALHGDHIVERSDAIEWYEGSSLLDHLENVHVSGDRNLVEVRFPGQCVILPHDAQHLDCRGYAGMVAGGVLRVCDEVVVLPRSLRSTVVAIDTASGLAEQGFPPMSVTVRPGEHINIPRGDMICRPRNVAMITQDIDAMMC
jgi:bifunctional enzyme CysN/CysC